jgi:lipid-A-disaccharide synthase
VRIFFSVGEPSGDLHASNLIRRLRSRDSSIECVGFGGPKMEAAGCLLLYELTHMAIMFLGQALANLRFFFRLIAQADQYFSTHAVDAVVLIDYSGFNWWIARKAKKHRIPVFYYGVPQVWAWAPWRIRKIRKLVDHILCKLPFEVAWFAARGCQATYVGHPYFDQLAHQEYDQPFLNALASDSRPLLLLLPGSRKQEVTDNLPILLDAALQVTQSVPQLRIAIASYNELQHQMAAKILEQKKVSESLDAAAPIELYVNRTPELMKSATVCLACSGSVSLELMYHRKPTVVVYHIQWWAMILQVFLIRVRYITLVNLIAAKDIGRNRGHVKRWFFGNPTGSFKIKTANREPLDSSTAELEDDFEAEAPPVMPEYLTSRNPARLVAAHATEWLTDEQSRQHVIDKLDKLALAYAIPGATIKAADYILTQLKAGAGQAPFAAARRLSA